MNASLSHAHQIMFADLLQKCLDAEFDEAFPENGSFAKVKSANGQQFWYYKGYRSGEHVSGEKRFAKYAGPVADPAVTSRVERFRQIKASFKERRALVSALHAAGLPSPTSLVGDIVESLWRAGLFRLQGVLVGTTAFQTYAGLLGLRLPHAVLMTGDVDFAQFHSISVSVEDSVPSILDALRQADQTFRELPSLDSPVKSWRYGNRTGFKVEFLTPNRGKDSYADSPAAMPALGGAHALPLRYLDFLIHQPVRSVLLHKGGIAVLVPAPERYAVHKLMVSELRRAGPDRGNKPENDISQALTLIHALSVNSRKVDLGAAFIEAGNRGSKWRSTLAAARKRISAQDRALIDDACKLARSAKG